MIEDSFSETKRLIDDPVLDVPQETPCHCATFRPAWRTDVTHHATLQLTNALQRRNYSADAAQGVDRHTKLPLWMLRLENHGGSARGRQSQPIVKPISVC
jgi:hypothetical protein